MEAHQGRTFKIAASFLLRGKTVMTQQVKTLSEGQKGLLSLACLNLQEPSILIMDEPTNHSTSIRINEHLYVNYSLSCS
jgi:ATPase subunit of ABC transporter with duplicated ATPase domains